MGYHRGEQRIIGPLGGTVLGKRGVFGMDFLEKILALTASARSWCRRVNMQYTDKDHKYFKCPNCGQKLRAPRGVGRFRVTCRSCGVSFEENS